MISRLYVADNRSRAGRQRDRQDGPRVQKARRPAPRTTAALMPLLPWPGRRCCTMRGQGSGHDGDSIIVSIDSDGQHDPAGGVDSATVMGSGSQ